MTRAGPMFFKLFIIIVVVGALACALLVIRQQRIEAAHEMSLIHQRLSESERTLWQLRGQIAAACRPDEVRRMVDRQGGSWMAIPAPPLNRPGPAPDPTVPRRMAALSHDQQLPVHSGG
jgi:hypothetical protein